MKQENKTGIIQNVRCFSPQHTTYTCALFTQCKVHSRFINIFILNSHLE
jgi:hypothetical protein